MSFHTIAHASPHSQWGATGCCFATVRSEATEATKATKKDGGYRSCRLVRSTLHRHHPQVRPCSYQTDACCYQTDACCNFCCFGRSHRRGHEGAFSLTTCVTDCNVSQTWTFQDWASYVQACGCVHIHCHSAARNGKTVVRLALDSHVHWAAHLDSHGPHASNLGACHIAVGSLEEDHMSHAWMIHCSYTAKE